MTKFKKKSLVALVTIFLTLGDFNKNIESTVADEHAEQVSRTSEETSISVTDASTTDSTASSTNDTSDVTSIVDLIINQSIGNDSNVSQQFIHRVSPYIASNYSLTTRHRSKNYASSECAKVIESNPEAKKTSYIINEMIDEYMLNPCKTKIWFVIELCEIIQATQIEIANYELYSSTPKDFTVYFSDTYPALDWKPIGHFTASDSRTLQTFDLNQVGFGKFIRVELHSHYGNEHYCVISEVRVYGASMVDEYEKSENSVDKDPIEDSNIKRASRKFKRKTSAYRVYRNMMVEPHTCGLSLNILDSSTFRNDTTKQNFYLPKEQPVKPILPQPTQQPVVNRTTPLKPSIFVELSNKVKALETLLKTQIEDMEKRLSEDREFVRRTEAKVDKLKLQFESFALIMIAYYVYKLMLDLM